MCTIALAFHAHPNYPLVLASNRDEFLDRPSRPAAFWEDDPSVLAGRDLKGGGTWLGITRTGRFAAITNVRRGFSERVDAPSRGEIISTYLRGNEAPGAFVQNLAGQADTYNGFNLICGDARSLHLFSNATGRANQLEPGVHALSNAAPGVRWPKIDRARERLAAMLQEDSINTKELLDLLADTHRPSDADLPDTGVGLDWERTLSSIFIRTDGYGTYASTVIIVDRTGNTTFVERRSEAYRAGEPDREYEFTIPEFAGDAIWTT